METHNAKYCINYPIYIFSHDPTSTSYGFLSSPILCSLSTSYGSLLPLFASHGLISPHTASHGPLLPLTGSFSILYLLTASYFRPLFSHDTLQHPLPCPSHPSPLRHLLPLTRPLPLFSYPMRPPWPSRALCLTRAPSSSPGLPWHSRHPRHISLPTPLATRT